MKDWKYKFLEKFVLGHNIDLNKQNDVLRKCIKLALKDTLTAGRYFIKKNINDICNELELLLNKYSNTFSRNLIDETCAIFGPNEIIGGGNRFVTRYGLSQKIVNMTFKYLFIFSDYLPKINFKNCDCPLDSTILNIIENNDIAWSKLNKANYEMCQEKIKKALGKQTLDKELQGLSNLAFDIINW